MEEKELKTSTGQRIFIAVIAVIMVGSIIASYTAMILNGSKSGSSTSSNTAITDEKKQQYTEEYYNTAEEFAKATMSDYEKFIAYKSEIKAFNEESANEAGTV